VYKRIRIKNFKSLRDIDLELRKVNVVVGPNGSGKSNLVDFFIFLKELINPSTFPSDPFQTFGGYEEVVFFRDTSLPISFEITGENFQYSADIFGKNGFMINRETLTYKDFLLSRTLYNVEMKNIRTMNIFKASLELTKSIFSLAKENLPFYPQPTITPPLDEFKELFYFMRSFANSFIPLRINPERAFAPVLFHYLQN